MYAQIPQASPELQLLAINSLDQYAALCRYFVAVVPRATHVDREITCDLDSYSNRGWCRLEQYARLTEGGVEGMYVYREGEELQRLEDSPEALQRAMQVYSGTFTIDEDKVKLVDCMLTLWVRLLRRCNRSSDAKALYELVCKDRRAIFPPTFFGELPMLLETRVASEGSAL